MDNNMQILKSNTLSLNKQFLVLLAISGLGFSLIGYFTVFSLASFNVEIQSYNSLFNQSFFIITVFIFSFTAGGFFTLVLGQNIYIESLQSNSNKSSSIIIIDGNNIAFESKPPSIVNIFVSERELKSNG